MKLYRSAVLASALVAVLMHSPKAQAKPAGMTDEQYLEVLKARDANVRSAQLNESVPSLGVVNPDGTVESVGRMQGNSDPLTPNFNYPKYPQTPQLHKPKAQAIPADSVWSNTEDVPKNAVPVLKGTYVERGNEYAIVTMKMNGSNVRVDYNVLVLNAAEQSKQDLRMCLTYSDPYYTGYACNPYTKQPLVLDEHGMCAVSLREKTVVNNLSVKTVVDMGVMSNGRCQVWNEF